MVDKRSINVWSVLLLVAIISLMLVAIFFGVRHSERLHARRISRPHVDGSVLPRPRRIKPFQLQATNDVSFTLASLRGHWSLLFFGYTHSHIGCSSTLTELAKMDAILRQVLPGTLQPEVVMVSVDPERDTLKRIRHYLQSFDVSFVGVRGNYPDVSALASQMNIVFHRMYSGSQRGDQYSISHSAELMLINPQAQLAAFLAYPHTAKQLVKDYERVVDA